MHDVKILDRNKKVGDVLENGYTIVATNGRKVLAFYNGTHKKEYATWIFGSAGSTDWGHYFTVWGNNTLEKCLESAMKDYNER